MFRKSLGVLIVLCMCISTVGCAKNDSIDMLSSRTSSPSIALQERGIESNKSEETSELVGFKPAKSDEGINFDTDNEELLENESYADAEVSYVEEDEDVSDDSVLLDEDGIKISYLGTSQQSEFQIYDAECEFEVVNDSDHNINVSIIDVSVNEFYTDTEAHWQVGKGKSVTGTLKFFGLVEKGITDIEDLDLAIRILDTDGQYCLIGYREKSIVANLRGIKVMEVSIQEFLSQ